MAVRYDYNDTDMFGLEDADLLAAINDVMLQQKADGISEFNTPEAESVHDMAMQALYSRSSMLSVYEANMMVGHKYSYDGKVSMFDGSGHRFDDLSNISFVDGKREVDLGYKGRDGHLIEYDDGRIFYSGPLGEGFYERSRWAIAYKDVKGETGSSRIPVIYHFGKDDGVSAMSPEGFVNVSHSWEDNVWMKVCPPLRDGTIMACGAFKGCRFERIADEAYVTFEDELEYRKSNGLSSIDATPLEFKAGTIRLPDSVEDISWMFAGCSNLRKGYNYISQDSHILFANSYGVGTSDLFLQDMGKPGGFESMVMQQIDYNQNYRQGSDQDYGDTYSGKFDGDSDSYNPDSKTSYPEGSDYIEFESNNDYIDGWNGSGRNDFVNDNLGSSEDFIPMSSNDEYQDRQVVMNKHEVSSRELSDAEKRRKRIKLNRYRSLMALAEMLRAKRSPGGNFVRTY